MTATAETRLNLIRAHFLTNQIDCLALVPGYNLRYITGIDFLQLERPLILFIPQAESQSPILLIPELEVTSWLAAMPFEAQIFPWSDQEGPEKTMELCLSAIPGLRTLGVEHLRMRVMEHQLIHNTKPDIRMVCGESVTNPLRLQKDASEIANHRKAADVCEGALASVLNSLQTGMTERQVCNNLMKAILELGGDMIPIEPTVLSGPNSALPHGKAGERKITNGDILLIDFVSTYHGYYADITRTFFVGSKPDDKFQQVYEAVKTANEAARKLVRPGITCEDVDRAARQVLVDCGLGKFFTHRTGHGLGLDVHEEPSIVEGNKMPLQEGMVFTIEPGAYIKGWGGVRIEDDIVVTKDGCESICSMDRALRILR